MAVLLEMPRLGCHSKSTPQNKPLSAERQAIGSHYRQNSRPPVGTAGRTAVPVDALTVTRTQRSGRSQARYNEGSDKTKTSTDTSS